MTLLQPLPGTAGGQRIFVLNVSMGGFLLAHQEPLGGTGHPLEVRFFWNEHSAGYSCELRWTRVQRVGQAGVRKALYHTGCRIAAAPEASFAVLRELIEEYVRRALEEQKANARGIPPPHAVALQRGTSSAYFRHELRAGRWQQAATSSPAQPQNGFTVSADLSQDEVQMLREAYERGDDGAREMIRRTSALSIGSKEGVPARRYMP